MCVCVCVCVCVCIILYYIILYYIIQGDSLERGPEYSVVTPVRMKQSKPKNYATYLDECVIDCITCDVGSHLRFLTHSIRCSMFLNVSASIREVTYLIAQASRLVRSSIYWEAHCTLFHSECFVLARVITEYFQGLFRVNLPVLLAYTRTLAHTETYLQPWW